MTIPARLLAATTLALLRACSALTDAEATVQSILTMAARESSLANPCTATLGAERGT
jgi:hypothetical protein